MWDYDVYKDLKTFSKPVLIVHGDEDKDVPLYYAREAQRTYPDAKLHVITGAGHMFPRTQDFAESCQEVVSFFAQQGMIE